MADGIAQIGGNGGDIRAQNNAHADAGGDGSYSFEDIYVKSNAGAWKAFDGVTPAVVKTAIGGTRAYFFYVNLQRGDGVGTTATTIKDSRCIVVFVGPGNAISNNLAKTYLTSAVGQANAMTEWGLLATSASGEPIGYDGVHAVFGTNPGGASGILGNIKLYGCRLENYNATAANSRVFINPGFMPNVSDIVDTLVFTLAGLQSFGLGSSGITIGRIKRLQSVGLGAVTAGHLVNFFADFNTPPDGCSFYWPNGDAKINTGTYVVMANPLFIGPSQTADVRGQQANILLNPTWSQNQAAFLPPFTEIWITYKALVTDQFGVPISGVRVKIYDSVDKRYVVNTLTDASGKISFLAPQSIAESPPFYTGYGSYPNAPFPNALLVSGHNNDGVMHDHFPFTLYVNQGREKKGYVDHARLLTFPYSKFLTTERQFGQVSQHILLEKIAAGYEDWREQYA